MAQFMEVHRLLEEVGATNPKGRIHHSYFGEDGHLMVFDIWEFEADSGAFGETLIPIQRLEQIEVK
jgi:hypothetical protein